MLKKLQEALFEIKYILQNDQELKKLLYFDVINPLEQENISELPIHYISLSPVQDYTTAEYNKNTRINIVITDRETELNEEQMLSSVISFYILSKNELWELNNNKIRTLEIANRLISLLDDRVLKTSNKMFFDSLSHVVYNENMSGYTVLFGLFDGNGLENDF